MVRTCTWTIWRRLVFTGFPCPSAQPGDILLCCFGASVANHAAIYCGNGELLHHLPEQLSKRERYSEKWQRRTHSAWRHRHWHASAFTGICNDLAAASACIEHGSGSPFRALSMQMPGFRRQMNEGWYQIRIRGEDTGTGGGVRPSSRTAWVRGPVIHIVPRLAGAERVDCRLCWGQQPSWALSSPPAQRCVVGRSP